MKSNLRASAAALMMAYPGTFTRAYLSVDNIKSMRENYNSFRDVLAEKTSVKVFMEI